jgi:hypothetical protein
MDADRQEDCPAELAKHFVNRIRAYGARRSVAIVFARREYEAWFVASLETIAGSSGIPAGTLFDGEVEELANPKRWVGSRFPRTRVYKETEDQAAMSEMIDFCLAAKRSRSFRRFTHAMSDLVRSIDAEQVVVTPTQ